MTTQQPHQTCVPFEVDEGLLRAIMAALAFLWHNDMDEHVYTALNDPSDATLAALNKLIDLRMHHG